MIIVHENLPREAHSVANAAMEVYGFASEITGWDFSNEFRRTPKFDAYFESHLPSLRKAFPSREVLALTGRDIYSDPRQTILDGDQEPRDLEDDDWIFGYSNNNHRGVVATARLGGRTSSPAQTIEVSVEQYLRRVDVMAVHEIGHSIVRAAHFQEATWVNVRGKRESSLGEHCTDNSCAMYEVVDLRAPDREEGYVQLAGEKRFDAGLDDLIERMDPNAYLCKLCRRSLQIDERYI
jgi:predicted Zn-dependent protease